jgi:cobalt-precorrin 5A hydrolase
MPTLVAGLGCQRGCPASALEVLLRQLLASQNLDPQCLCALGSIDLKADEPGLLELAKQLRLPLITFSAEQLAPYASSLTQRSDQAFAHTRCYGVAESAALALAEQLSGQPAYLLVPRQTCGPATGALAWADSKSNYSTQ